MTAARGDHDSAVRSRVPASGRLDDIDEVGLQTGQHDLGLGVPEPAVELDDLGAVGGEDESGVQEPGIRHPLLRHDREGRHDDPALHLFEEARRELDGRKAPHPPGVGAGVAVPAPLVVAGRLEREGPAPVADGEDRQLGSGEVLLDENRRPGGAEPPGEAVRHPGVGGVRVGGDEHPLAAGEPVGLDDVGAGLVLEVRVGEVGVGEDGRVGGRHPGPAHDVLGEGLRRLEAGGRPGRAEHGDAAGGTRRRRDRRRGAPRAR